MENDLLIDESIEDLQLDGLKLIQKKHGFRFGVDAVILADFVSKMKAKNVLDIGTGTGIIPILLAARTRTHEIIGLEIQEAIAEMAQRTVRINGLQDRIKIVSGDIKCWDQYFKKAQFDLIVSNPPYMIKGTGLENPNDSKAISRHELLCSLEEVISAASSMLKTNGKLAMVHRPHRLVDLMEGFRKYSIEPKTVRFVYSNIHSKPVMLLVEGTKGGRRELKILNNLYIFDQDGNYTDEINRIYLREKQG